MTTRRRRTGSESNGEDLLVATLPQVPLKQVSGVAGVPLPWGASPVPLPASDAYYKKTDNLTPQPVAINNNFTSKYSQFQVNFDSNNQNNLRYLPNSLAEDDGVMSFRDRSQEFQRIVKSQHGSYSNGNAMQNGTGPHQKRPRDLRQYTGFMQRSKLIGRNISSTYAKLEKLTHLAKKRSLFDDSSDREIQELTGIIRHDLTALTRQLEDLRTLSRGGVADGEGSGHLQKHSQNLVGSLQARVASITQHFRDVLEVRTENLKKQAERREKFTGGVVSGELPPSAFLGHHQGSVLLADEVSNGGGQVAINMGGASPYQDQLRLMEEQDTYVQNRAETMKTIESTIVELGQMFTQLATMVKEQEELVTRIDTNVEDAEMNVEAAHTELLKYFKSISSNRWLMVKVFGIMIVFFFIFVVFMV